MINFTQKPYVYILNMYNKKIASFEPINAKANLSDKEISQFTFDIHYMLINEVTKNKYINPLYEYIEATRRIYVSDLGYFYISTVEIESDGIQEIKHVTCKSIQYTLTKVFVDDLKVRIDEKNNNMVLCKVDSNGIPTTNTTDSLMHYLLKDTDWTVGYCDPGLAQTAIVLDVDRASKYDIIMDDILNFLDVNNLGDTVIIFDYKNMQVNIYDNNTEDDNNHFKKKRYSVASNITLTFDSLIENATVQYDESEVKTVLRAEGEDIYINEVNGGSDSITDLTFYATEDGHWMDTSLANKYNKYYRYLYEPDFDAGEINILEYYTEISKYLHMFETRRSGLELNIPTEGHYFTTLNREALDNLREKPIYDTETKQVMTANINAITKKVEIEYEYIIQWGNFGGIEYGLNFLEEGCTLLYQLISSEMARLVNENENKNPDEIQYDGNGNVSNGLLEYYKLIFVCYRAQLSYETINYIDYEYNYKLGNPENNNIRNLNRKSEDILKTYGIHKFNIQAYIYSIQLDNVIAGLQNIMSKLTYFYSYSGYIALNAHEEGEEVEKGSLFKNSMWNISEDFNKFYKSENFDKRVQTMDIISFDLIWSSRYSNDYRTKYKIPISTVNEYISYIINEYFYDSLLTTEEIDTYSNRVLHFPTKENISSDNYFTTEEIKALKRYEFHDEYIDNNFKLLEDDTKQISIEKSTRLFTNAKNKMKKLSKPLISFSANIANPYIINAFKPLLDSQDKYFSMGCQVEVLLRNDYVVTVTIESIDIDYEEPENFSFTCTNCIRNRSISFQHYIERLGKTYRYQHLFKRLKIS